MQGHVIRIFDRRRVVIDLGSDDGVDQNMKFEIYSPGTAIQGLNDEDLGEYRLHKATVMAREVYPRFCVAMPPNVRERVVDENAPSGALQSIFRSAAQYRTVPGQLPVERHEIEPLEGGSSVAVGDVAEAFVVLSDQIGEDNTEGTAIGEADRGDPESS